MKNQHKRRNRMLTLALTAALSLSTVAGSAEAVPIIGMGGGSFAVAVASGEDENGMTASVGKAGVTIENLQYDAGIAYIDGDIYVLKDNGLYRLPSGSDTFEQIASYERTFRYFSREEIAQWDEETRELASKVPSKIFVQGGELCGLSTVDGTYGPIGEDGFIQKRVALEWTDMLTEYGVRDMRGTLVVSGMLYAQLEPVGTNGYSSDDMRFARFDLETGEKRDLELMGEYMLCEYKDGKLLAYHRYNGEGVRVYDPEADTLGDTLIPAQEGNGVQEDKDGQAGIGYSGGGITYDANSDAVYFVENSMIKTYANGEIQELAYIPVDYASNIQGCQLDGERYFCFTWDGAYLRSLSAQDQPERILRIGGTYFDETTRKFSSTHPDTPVIADNGWYAGADAVRTDMLSGSSDIDIYALDAVAARTLMEKGYLQDLSASQALMDDVARMYPQLSQAVLMDGKLYAYPKSLSMNLWAVYPKVWEALDLGDYPTTFLEYVELIQTWNEEYAEDYPEYTVTSIHNGKEELFSQALGQYVYQYEREDEPLSFNTPEFRETMEAIEALDLTPVDWENMSDADMEEMWAQMDRPPLFSMNVYNTVSKGGNYYRGAEGGYEEYEEVRIVPPSFTQEHASVVPVNMTVYIVNPESKNVDLAMEYLEYYAANAEATTRYEMHPDLSEPVRPSYYQQNVKEYEKSIAEMEAEMEKAEEEDKATWQESIDSMRAYLDDMEKNEWQISEESLANYRALAENMVVPVHSIFLSAESAALSVLQDVLTRYMDGQITLDVFIRELDQKTRMIFLEGH